MRNGSGEGGAEGPEMHTTPRVRLSRAAAERLLVGGEGPSDLRRLVAAAAAPAAAHELAGEAAAVAAFAAARDTAPVPAEPAHRTSALGTALSKLFAAKALVGIALVAGATGGVALTTSSAGAPQGPPVAADVGARPSGTSAAGGSDASIRPTGSAMALPPGAGIAELCRAWLAGDPGAEAGDPGFTELVTTAGGADHVAAFCADLPAPATPGASGSTPGRSGTAPGRAGTSPGKSGTPPGQSGTTPGQSGTTPGKSGTTPGKSGTAPGQSGTAPGQSGTAPGQSGTAPGQSGTTPGQSGTTPGQSGATPGKSGTAPGQSGTAPGQSETGPNASGAASGRVAAKSEPPGQSLRSATQEPAAAAE
jgi:hypothetical protein